MDEANDCKNTLRPLATGTDNVLFTMRDLIVETMRGEYLDTFRAFLQHRAVDSYLVVTDYCFHAGYPNDTMVFSLVKGGQFLPSGDQLAALKADLKNVREVDPSAVAFLRDPKIFTFAIVLEKKTKIHASRPLMKESMAESIRLQSTWVNANVHEEAIARFKELLLEANSNGFNALLYDRMLLASMIAAIVSALVVENNPTPVQSIGWFSDRDAIVEKGTALATHLYATALNAYCAQARLSYPPTVGVINHSDPSVHGEDPWFDPITRIADYFAGPLAQVDYAALSSHDRVEASSRKHQKLFSEVFADNSNLVVIRFLGKLPPFRASQIRFSRTPIQSDDVVKLEPGFSS